MKDIDPSIYKNGVRFQCQGCGRCCQSRGGYSYVYVSLAERQRLARHLRLSTRAFTLRYCEKTEGVFHLRDPENGCLFAKGNRCSVYRARPAQCRTWPFWPENMTRKVWRKEVLKDCKGIGTGPLLDAGQVEKRLRRAAKQ